MGGREGTTPLPPMPTFIPLKVTGMVFQCMSGQRRGNEDAWKGGDMRKRFPMLHLPISTPFSTCMLW